MSNSGSFNFKVTDWSDAFVAHYDTHLLPLVERFEQNRRKAIEDMKTRRTMSIPVCVAIVAAAILLLLNTESTNAKFFWLIAGAGALSGVYYLVTQPLRNYKTSVKTRVFPEILSFLGETFKYSITTPYGVKSLKKSGIVPSFSSEKTEDFIHGEHKGVSIELMEAKLEQDSGDSSVTVFEGLCIKLGMNKNFSCKTIVKKDRGTAVNWLAGNVSHKFSSNTGDLQRVTLEDPVFENSFEVYSNDQVEARYLLSTSFMERLLALQSHYGGVAVQASFYDNNLLLMIPSQHNHFETSSIYRRVDFRSEAKTVIREMQGIFQIVEILKLYETNRL